MTLPEFEPVVIHGHPLSSGATPKCAICGSQRQLGRIASPIFEYGIVVCGDHAPELTASMIESYGVPGDIVEVLIHDARLR